MADVRAHNHGLTDAVEGRLRSLGHIRALVVGNYGEVSDDGHQLLDAAANTAAAESWRLIGARSIAEAKGYYVRCMRRSWGIAFAREFARHRLRRVGHVGAPRLATRAERARAAQATTLGGEWAHRSPCAFMTESARASGAVAARHGVGWQAVGHLSKLATWRSVGWRTVCFCFGTHSHSHAVDRYVP